MFQEFCVQSFAWPFYAVLLRIVWHLTSCHNVILKPSWQTRYQIWVLKDPHKFVCSSSIVGVSQRLNGVLPIASGKQKLRLQTFVWLFAWNFGQIILYLSTTTVGSWWSWWGVMVASLCYIHGEGDGLVLCQWCSWGYDHTFCLFWFCWNWHKGCLQSFLVELLYNLIDKFISVVNVVNTGGYSCQAWLWNTVEDDWLPSQYNESQQ